MGQYYKPILLKKNRKTPIAFAYCYDFGNGAKLMEHSYIGNSFVGFIETQLLNNPTPLVWAGDYADEEPFEDIPKKVIKNMLSDNEYYNNDIEQLKEEGVNLHGICNYGNVPKLSHNIHIRDGNAYDADFSSVIPNLTESRFIVNHTKKLAVDKRRVEVIDPESEWQDRIHPLPLLTCEGNGRGGGDFGGDEKGLVGSWARDTISLEEKKPKGYKILTFDLKE